MIIKCILEDDSVFYKNLSLIDLYEFVDSDKILDFLSENFGEIEDWNFTSGSGIVVDIREYISTDDPPIVKINNKKISRIEFLKSGDYEHLIGSFCLETVSPWNYNVKISYNLNNLTREYYEAPDPYSDEPPDYD